MTPAVYSFKPITSSYNCLILSKKSNFYIYNPCILSISCLYFSMLDYIYYTLDFCLFTVDYNSYLRSNCDFIWDYSWLFSWMYISFYYLYSYTFLFNLSHYSSFYFLYYYSYISFTDIYSNFGDIFVFFYIYYSRVPIKT